MYCGLLGKVYNLYMKKILLFLVLLLVPFAVSAEAAVSQNSLSQDSSAFTDGAVLRQKGYSKYYLFHEGKKWRLATPYTVKKFGVTRKNIIEVSKSILKNMPDGEKIRISPSKIKGRIDAHEHYRVGGNMEQYLKIARSLDINKTIFVGTGMGPDNAGYKEHTAELLQWQDKYPDQVIAFCTIDEADPDAPEVFRKCLKNDGKGLKILGGHPEFYDVPLNNDIMKQVFAIAQEADVPVLIHASIISIPQLKDELADLFDEFPDVRVNWAHYCSTIYSGINLNQCEEFLDKYPNLYIDLSMGGGIARYFKYMTANMQPIKDFVLKYQDRIMFGSDIILAGGNSPTNNPKWLRGRMECDLNLHQEHWYKCPTMNNKGDYALLPGFDFPEEILRKIYIENPRKFLGQD